MKRRKVHRTHQNVPAGMQNKLPWRLILITIFCTGTVAAGFFLAARQHFATMEYGIKNSKLRKQVEGLEAERRRLILAKEVSLSPFELKQNAAKLGFREQIASPPTAAEIRLEKSAGSTLPKAELTGMKLQETPSSATTRAEDSRKLVKPIIQQSPAKPASPDVRPRIAETEKRAASGTVKSISKLR